MFQMTIGFPLVASVFLLEVSTSVLQSMCMCAKSLQLCPTLCDPMDHSLPGPSVHRICQSFLTAQLVKNLPAMQEIPVQFLGQEDLLEKG